MQIPKHDLKPFGDVIQIVFKRFNWVLQAMFCLSESGKIGPLEKFDNERTISDSDDILPFYHCFKVQ